MLKVVGRTLASLLVFATAAIFGAATPQEIVIAQVAPFSSPIALYSNSTYAGAAACFAAINAAGGIHGAKIRFIKRDDKLDPKTTVALYRQLAQEEHPIAFFYPIAPASIDALLDEDVPQTLGIPIIGTIPPMYRRRTPVNPFVFHVGVGDDREVTSIVRHMATLNIKDIAIVYWNDPSIVDVSNVAAKEAERRGIRIALRVALPPTRNADLGLAAKRIVDGNPSAVMLLLPVVDTAKLAAKLRELGFHSWIYGQSYNDSKTLFRVGGQGSVGLVVSQVVPNPFSPKVALASEYQVNMRKFAPGVEFSTLSFEGYIGAKIIVRALQRLRTTPSPAGLKSSLEGLRDVDLGGLRVNYSEESHVGLNFLDMGMVTSDGGLAY